MKTQILAASSPGEVCVAATRDGDLIDYGIWRPGAPDGVGDLHRGRITARAPAMAGAFVALAGTNGFLPDSSGASGLTSGDIIMARVTRAAQGEAKVNDSKGTKNNALMACVAPSAGRSARSRGPARRRSRQCFAPPPRSR